MKTAVIIVGAESTGTWFTNMVFLSQGFFGSVFDPQDVMLLDKDLEHPKVTMRMSLPHGGEWLAVGGHIKRLSAMGYICKVVVTMRDMYCVVQSHVTGGKHSRDAKEALRKIGMAYNMIFEVVRRHEVDYTILPYETHIAHYPNSIVRAFEVLGLGEVDVMALPVFENGDKKWYERTD